MKHLLLILAATVCLTPALRAQTGANSPSVHPSDSGPKRMHERAMIAQAVKHHLSVAFITTYVPTGSHIPQVVIFYKGHYYAANNFSVGNVYSGRAIEESGALDVGSALSSLDPAITR